MRVWTDIEPWATRLGIENYGESSERVVKIRERMLKRGDELCTSTLTLGDILVKPLDEDREELAADYELALTSASVVISNWSSSYALENAAELELYDVEPM
ncbi:MAG: hypothetical protein BMS9Abin37_1479 [Acidobacteriota bacterium]|nr:MAG: hypothetical protein BMS9Abin37_1479 [Acidobacteriota bacterium]